MASINLKHTSGNGTILNSPAANPSSDITLKLPSTTGSAGQVLKVASANHSATNAELEFGADSGGKFASYAIICDQKATDANGGSSSSGAFNTRDLNTELADPDGIVSISSNQFTLQAGSYLIKASAPAHKAQRHQMIIWNATDSSVAALGTCEYTYPTSLVTTRSYAQNRITISGAKVFEVRHRVQSSESSLGLGVASNFDTLASIYTIVEIYKES